MTKMLDILGDYLNLKKIKFCRLDGSMQFMDRQENIDTFNKDPEHKVLHCQLAIFLSWPSLSLETFRCSCFQQGQGGLGST